MILKEVERELEFLVEEAPKAQSERIVEAVVRLDTLAREHRTELPAGLVHYLQGHSYSKALQYIRGEKPAHGHCGH